MTEMGPWSQAVRPTVSRCLVAGPCVPRSSQLSAVDGGGSGPRYQSAGTKCPGICVHRILQRVSNIVNLRFPEGDT